MKTILLAGATGLVGRAVADIFDTQADDQRITALVRRDVPYFAGMKNCRPQVINFDALEDAGDHIRGDIFICTLGTTIKKAGSKERFFEIDHGYPLALARMARENGTRRMILVSSVGADAASPNHYLRTKGRLEADLSRVGFESLDILRPSLLLGKRDEFRPGEEIARLIAPALAFLTPPKYRPVSAVQLARKIYAIAAQGEAGVHIHQGKALR